MPSSFIKGLGKLSKPPKGSKGKGEKDGKKSKTDKVVGEVAKWVSHHDHDHDHGKNDTVAQYTSGAGEKNFEMSSVIVGSVIMVVWLL